MTRIAVIGLGRWGRRLIGKLDPSQIVSVLVTDPAKHDGAWPRVSSFDDLAASKPSHVFVLSPISCQYEHTLQALSLGADVFVEKPFTYSCGALADISARLSENGAQKLHVNHLFQYSKLLNDPRHTPPSRIMLRWHKFSASSFSIEDNLLSHAASILLVVFGPSARIRLRERHIGRDSLSLDLEVEGADACISISVSRDPATPQVMSLICGKRDGARKVDLLEDPVDKLQRSVDDFFHAPPTQRMKNFNFHCSIARVMRSFVEPAKPSRHPDA